MNEHREPPLRCHPSLRWTNLWWPFEPLKGVQPGCNLWPQDDGLGSFEFISNIVLVMIILLVLFVLHVIVVSGVEAHWLCKVSGKD